MLTFLDAHVECNEGWLQPLLSRIADDRSVIAVPLIDTISSSDYSYQYGETITITGFRWTLIFNWYVTEWIRMLNVLVLLFISQVSGSSQRAFANV